MDHKSGMRSGPSLCVRGEIRLIHQPGHFAGQHRQFRPRDAPDNPVVNLGIRVSQNIPEANNAAEVSDSGGKTGVYANELPECLANDREGPLNGQAQHRIFLVILKILAFGELGYELRRFKYVKETSAPQSA